VFIGLLLAVTHRDTRNPATMENIPAHVLAGLLTLRHSILV
jgi:hypothetical protein